MAKLDDLIEAKDELSTRLLRNRDAVAGILLRTTRKAATARGTAGRNLHAIGVGRKLAGGKRTKTLCVRFYVLEKVAAGIIPRAALLPRSIAGLPTDVIESPLAEFHQPCTANRRKRIRPIVGGISAANFAAARSATLGSFCRSVVRGEASGQFILGCNHSFANLGVAVKGSPILQHAPADGGAAVDAVARLWRYAPLVFGLGGANLVDGAIARVMLPVATRAICHVGPIKGVTPATLGMRVRKHGRTTGYTEGEVTDVSLDGFVMNYDDGSQAVFVNQHRIEPTLGYAAPDDEIALDGSFAAKGDSGSLIVEKTTQRAVGLHFAGAYGISITNPIIEVCRALRIAFP